jgi:hypothetical protein
MGEMRNTHRILFEKMKARRHMEDLGGKIRQWILYAYSGRVWSGLMWPRIDYWQVITKKAMKLG